MSKPNSKSTKTHWKDFFDYKYLGSQDLDVGKDLVVTLTRHNQEEHTVTGGKKEKFLVVYFDGIEKGMIFNKTNSRTMMVLAKSAYVEDWIGKTIALYITTTNFGGKTVEALRIREKAPKAVKPESLSPKHKHWNYAIKELAAGRKTIAQIKKALPLDEANQKLLVAAATALELTQSV